MKKITQKLTLGLALVFSTFAYASHENKPHLDILSQITTDTLGTAHFTLQVQVPLGNQIATPGLVQNKYALSSSSWQTINDSVKTIALQLNYNPNNLPFYPEQLKLKLPYTSSTGDLMYTEESFWVYFAPYGETEVWSTKDFYDLPRAWLAPTPGNTPKRKFMPKSTLPITDLPADFRTIYTDEQWVEQKIEGLGYTLLKKLPKQTSLAKGTGLCDHHYHGNIRATVFTEYLNDDTRNIPNDVLSRPITGLRYEINRYRDLSTPEKMHEGIIPSNGVISHNLDEESCVGGGFDLFIQIFAEDPELEIKGFNQVLDLSVQSFRTGSIEMKPGSNPFNIDFGMVEVINPAIKAVDLCEDAAQFCADNGVGLRKGLDVVMNSGQTQMMPNKVFGFPINVASNASYYFQKPTLKMGNFLNTLIGIHIMANPLYQIVLRRNPHIFFENEDAEHENTAYHEFGHFMMWDLQDTKWYFPNSAQFEGHSAAEENDAPLAWTEGWAQGFMGMVDAYYRNRDGEYGLDGENYDVRAEFSTVGLIANGIHSEYNIGCAVFDIWDGAFLGLNQGRETWHDAQNDNLSLPLLHMILPLKNGIVPQNYGDYYRFLSATLTNCADKSELNNINRINDVVANANVYDNRNLAPNPIFGNLSVSSFLGQFVDYDNFDEDGDPVEYLLSTGNVIDRHYVIIPNLVNLPNVLSVSIPNNNEFLLDPLHTTGGIETINLISQGANSKLQTCGRGDLIVTAGVRNLTVGTPNLPLQLIISDRTILRSEANVLVNQGSTVTVKQGGGIELTSFRNSIMTIQSGASLIIEENGSLDIGYGSELILESGAKLILKNGAYLCVKSGGKITRKAGFSNIQIEGVIKTGVYPQSDLLNGFYCTDFMASIKGTQNAKGVIYNQPKCNGTFVFETYPSNIDRNFSFGIQDSKTAWNDGTISWYFPASWQINGSNPTGAYEVSRSGLVGFANPHEEAYAIVSSSAGTQVITFALDRPQMPYVILKDQNNVEIRSSELELCDYDGNTPIQLNIVHPQSSRNNPLPFGKAPFTYQWQLPWDLNYKYGTQGGQLLLNKSQPRSNMEDLILTVRDANQCVYQTKLTIVPSVQWFGGYLSETYANISTSQFTNVKASKAEHVYFVNNRGELRYYYWDLAQQKWLLSTPIATSCFEHVEIDEDNATTTTVSYSIYSPTYSLKQISFDKASKTWGVAQTILSISPRDFHVKGKDGAYYFVSYGELYKVTSPTTFSLLTTGVTGVELLATTEGIFFMKMVNGVQKIALYKTLDGQISIFETNVKPKSQLNKDSKENVYYINSSGVVSYLPKTNGVYANAQSLPYASNTNSQYQSATPNFTINAATDVIYYTGANQDIYQLYALPTKEWLSVNIIGHSWNSYSKVSGYVTYSSPHPFFVSYGNVGNYFFIPQENCNNIREREGAIAPQIELSVLPNPVDNFLQVNAIGKEKIEYTIRNFNGSVVDNGYVYSEDFIDVSNLIVGSYIVELNQNGKTAIEKISVLR